MNKDSLAIIDGYNCGLGLAFQVVGGKWKAVILWLLSERSYRFGELKRQLPGISERILINQLREMEAHGIILRKAYNQIPPKVEYFITPLGATLNEALCPLSDWGLAHEGKLPVPECKNPKII